MLLSAESTNALLKDKIRASSAAVPDVIAAKTQTAGRGRLGRSFFSPEGGLYFSAAYPLTGREINIPFLTLLSGLAVSEALGELTGAETRIKWPNDIYLNGKKLCGILTEYISSAAGPHAVVGIGMNLRLRREDLPPELADKVTSLAAQGLPCPDAPVLIGRITAVLDAFVYERDLLNVTDPAVLGKLNALSFLTGKRVTRDGERGVFTGIAPDGSAIVDFGDGKKNIFSGELTYDARTDA